MRSLNIFVNVPNVHYISGIQDALEGTSKLSRATVGIFFTKKRNLKHLKRNRDENII